MCAHMRFLCAACVFKYVECVCVCACVFDYVGCVCSVSCRVCMQCVCACECVYIVCMCLCAKCVYVFAFVHGVYECGCASIYVCARVCA